MSFSELNSVEHYIIHQLSGVNLNAPADMVRWGLCFVERSYTATSSVTGVENMPITGLQDLKNQHRVQLRQSPQSSARLKSWRNRLQDCRVNWKRQMIVWISKKKCCRFSTVQTMGIRREFSHRASISASVHERSLSRSWA